ncbi:MAG: RNA-binding protein [Chitinophagaceae bacterium]|nr:MAG: RNA-binding protein [Chitinophagaceae bacterium]
MNIYVVNLSPGVGYEELAAHFEPYGKVVFCRVIMDPYTRNSKGHGFVEMAESEAQAAITALDRSMLLGQEVRVMEARPKELRNEAPPDRRTTRDA